MPADTLDTLVARWAQEKDSAGDPRARSPHAAFSTGARNCAATAAARP